MTKEDILSDHLQKYLLTTADIYNGTTVIKVCIERAMEEYADIKAKEVAIEFAEWILKESILPRDTKWFDAGKHYTTDQLFDLYINSKQQ